MTVIELAARRRTRGGCCWGVGDGRRCGQTEGTVMFPSGPLCPAHTPAARKGQPEPAQVLADWQTHQTAQTSDLTDQS